jgi:hypothetical protein
LYTFLNSDDTPTASTVRLIFTIVLLLPCQQLTAVYRTSGDYLVLFV